MNISFANKAAGPLLEELLEAQSLEAAAVSYPAIEGTAAALIARAQQLDAVVWPVGGAAERIAGAAALLAEGEIEIGVWNTRLDGERVLLFAVAGATPLSLVAAAAQVRSMGATEVHACGVEIAGAAAVDVWDSYVRFQRDRQTTPPSVLSA